MKKTTYSCDLCKNEYIEPEVAAIKLGSINDNKPYIVLDDTKVFKETEKRHICFSCIDTIHEHRNKIATD